MYGIFRPDVLKTSEQYSNMSDIKSLLDFIENSCYLPTEYCLSHDLLQKQPEFTKQLKLITILNGDQVQHHPVCYISEFTL